MQFYKYEGSIVTREETGKNDNNKNEWQKTRRRISIMRCRNEGFENKW